MVNILIPTDFSQASFRMAEQAVKTLNRKVNVILFHAYEMPADNYSLLRATPPYLQTMNDSFRQNCKYLKCKYPNLINTIRFKYFQGSTNALFNNFAEANAIDMIVCPDNYVYRKIHTNSINPIPFFKKSRIPLLKNFIPTKVERKPATVETMMEEMELASV